MTRLAFPLLLLSLLLTACASSGPRGPSPENQLSTCLRTGNLTECQSAVDRGAKIATFKKNGRSALNYCIRSKACGVEQFRWLEATGADPKKMYFNKKSSRWTESTATHSAARFDRKDIVEYLSSRPQFQVDAPGWLGYSPLSYAQSIAVYELLIGKGADPMRMQRLGTGNSWANYSALHHYARRNRHDLVKHLLANGDKSLNRTDKHGWMPLHYAAKGGNQALIDTLIAAGANVTARTSKSQQTYQQILKETRVALLKKRRKSGKLKRKTLTFTDGTKYQGEVWNNKPFGKGTYTNKNKVSTRSDHWEGRANAYGAKIAVDVTSSLRYEYLADRIANSQVVGRITSRRLKVTRRMRQKNGTMRVTRRVMGKQAVANAVLSHDIRKIPGMLKNDDMTNGAAPVEYLGILDVQGRKQGFGRLTTPQHKTYLGAFKDDLFHDKKAVFHLGANTVFRGAFFNSFKVGYGRTYLGNGNEYRAVYERGKETGWTYRGKGVYKQKRVNGSTQQHWVRDSGYLRKVNNGKSIKEYNLSDPDKFIVCPISNHPIYKKILVPGKGCSRARIGFTPNMLVMLENLRLDKKDPTRIKTAVLVDLFSPTSTSGRYEDGVGDITLKHHKTKAVTYRGSFKNSKKHGQALCRYKESLEPCEYNVGKRVDQLHLTRLAYKKEQLRLAREASCQKTLDQGISRLDDLADLDLARCERPVADMDTALGVVISRADCKACGQRSFRNAKGSSYACIEKGQDRLRRLKRSADRNIQNMAKSGCFKNGEVRAMRRDLRSIDKGMSTQLRSLKKSTDQLAADYKRIIWPKLERIESQRNAKWMTAISSMRRAASDIMAQRQRNHNQRMAILKEQKSIQKRIRRKQAAMKRRAPTYQRSGQNGRTTVPHKRIDVVAVAKKSCSARGHTWRNNRCHIQFADKVGQTMSAAKIAASFPGRACYDPTGKICKTGETIGYQRSDQRDTGTSSSGVDRASGSKRPPDRSSNQAGNQASGRSGGQSTSNPSGRSSGLRKSPRGGSKGERRMGKIKVETLAYCWQNKKKTKWRCHGTTQKTILFEANLEQTLKTAGCSNGTRRRAFGDGFIWYCGFGMESYHDDVAAIYNVPSSLLSQRTNYQCQWGKLATCRDVKA